MSKTSGTQARKPTIDQRRAEHAWKKVNTVDRGLDRYRNIAKGLPALIMTSGLMQVMAYLQQKKGEEALVGEHLRDWLHLQSGTPRDFEGFMEHLFKMSDSRQYQSITTEAFAWLRWLRQLSSAV